MKIVKKFLSFSIGTWLGAVVGLITIPLMTRLFSPEELGRATMFTLALNVLMLFTMFGVDQAFIRFFYEEETKKLLRKCLTLTFCVFLVNLVLIFIFRKPLSVYLFGFYDPWIMLLLGMASIIYALNNYSLAVLRMSQMGWQYSIAQLALRLLELVFIILFFYLLGNGYSTLVLAKVLTIFLVTVIAVMLRLRYGKPQQLVAAREDHSMIEILKYSYPLALTAVLNWMLQSTDKIAIKQWSTYKELGVYVAAYRIVAILDVIVTSFSVYWTPLALERFLKRSYDENKVFYQKANAMISFGMIMAVVGLIMSKDLIVLMLGKNYRDAATIMPFLVFYPLMYITSETTVIGINFFKKVRWHLLISFAVLAVNISSNLLLVPRLGARGAAISIGMSYVLFFVLRTHISLRYYKVGYYLKRFYALVALIICYAFYSAFFTWGIFNLFSGLLVIGVTVIAYYKDLKYGLNMYYQKA